MERKDVGHALDAYSKALQLMSGQGAAELESILLCNQAAALVAAKRCPDALFACLQVRSIQCTQSAHPLYHLQQIDICFYLRVSPGICRTLCPLGSTTDKIIVICNLSIYM